MTLGQHYIMTLDRQIYDVIPALGQSMVAIWKALPTKIKILARREEKIRISDLKSFGSGSKKLLQGLRTNKNFRCLAHSRIVVFHAPFVRTNTERKIFGRK